jgi:hypothetical protein
VKEPLLFCVEQGAKMDSQETYRLAAVNSTPQLLRPVLADGLSLVFAAGSLEFFSITQLMAWLAFGAALGFVGAQLAVRRYALG